MCSLVHHALWLLEKLKLKCQTNFHKYRFPARQNPQIQSISEAPFSLSVVCFAEDTKSSNLACCRELKLFQSPFQEIRCVMPAKTPNGG